MKIFFLSAANDIHTIKWVNILAQKEHEIFLIYIPNHTPVKDTINSKVHLMPLKFSGKKGYFLNALELNKKFKELNPHVVNAHFASGYGTLARMAKLDPLVLSVWGSDVYDFPYKNKVNMKLIKNNLNYAKIISSTSYNMALQVKKLLNKNKDIAITPFGVDLNLFDKERFNNQQTKDKIIIGNVKKLAYKYGIDVIIKAFRLLMEELELENNNIIVNKLELHIYGNGPQWSDLKKLTQKLNIQDKVVFFGQVSNNEVPKALHSMDVFCLGSRVDSESFGVAAVEAMAMELPVVATDVSGFKEVIMNGETGIIVKRNNPEEMCKALKKLILNAQLRELYGKAGREHVKKNYNIEDNVKSMEDIYYKTIEQKASVDNEGILK